MAGLLTLGACSARDAGTISARTFHLPFIGTPTACEVGNAGKLAGVDWGKAQVVNVTIRQGLYSPALFDMKLNAPYVLRFDNRDDRVRGFRSDKFFRGAGVAASTPGETPDGCIAGMKVAANSKAELRLVPGREGSYRWYDNIAPWGIGFGKRAGFGVINIQ